MISCTGRIALLTWPVRWDKQRLTCHTHKDHVCGNQGSCGQQDSVASMQPVKGPSHSCVADSHLQTRPAVFARASTLDTLQSNWKMPDSCQTQATPTCRSCIASLQGMQQQWCQLPCSSEVQVLSELSGLTLLTFAKHTLQVFKQCHPVCTLLSSDSTGELEGKPPT